MGKEKVGIKKICLLKHDLLAKQPDSRPGIDYHPLCATSDFETGGIATVFHGIRPGTRDTPARAPKFELK
jgi:hypothetical protein